MKNLYDYFFYKIYKSVEYLSVPKFWSDWKSLAIIVVLEILTCNILEVSYHYYFNIPMQTVGSQRIGYYEIILVSFLIIVNYYLFIHNDKWKAIIDKFDSRKKNDILGGFIVWSIILSVVVIYWFYTIPLLSEIKYE